MLPKSFSIRTLLILTTLVCVGLAIWTYRAKKQQQLVASLHDVGARVLYDYMVDRKGAKPKEPIRFSRILGQDYFHTVVGVMFYPEPTEEADELIKLLDDAPSVNRFAIWPGGGKGLPSLPNSAPGGLTDAGLDHLLTKHPNLVYISLVSARLSPASVERLKNHPTLSDHQIALFGK